MTLATLDVMPGLTDDTLVELVREHGTPLYVYDLRRLVARVDEIRAALDGARAQLFFATMANDRLPVLQTLSSAGVGACVNSIPHLELARQAGFPEPATQFTSTGISRDDMEILHARGIRTNLDSVSQLAAWFDLGGREAGLRVNAASLTGQRAGDRIGVHVAHIPEAIRAAERRGAMLTGLHVYVGTNFQRAEAMLPTLAEFFNAARGIPDLQYVNIGGGIGIDYQHTGVRFDLNAFGASVRASADSLRNRLDRDIRVVFEPGRALVAGCGTFLTRITDSKELAGDRFVSVDASVAVFPRPLHHPDSPHRIRWIESLDPYEPRSSAIVVGRTTFSRDILGTATLPQELGPDSLLAFDDAGAYCASMASRFLGQPDAAEVFVDSR